jgi:Tfp pilus assembly protein PilZ
MDQPSVKRRYLRKDYVTSVEFNWKDEMRSCLSTTLSEGGLYAQTLIPPPVGAQILLRFKLPSGESIAVTGEVRHSLENSYGSLPAGFGVQFLDLGEQDRLKIVDFVNSDDI